VTVAQPRRGAGVVGIDPVDAGSRVGQPLSILPVVVSMIGVFTTVAAMVILPMRRRPGGSPARGVDSAI
jgi:hypothetical protein